MTPAAGRPQEASAARTPPEPSSYRFRLAICSGTFHGWSFADACKGAVRTGYEAIEIAPHLLSDDPNSLSAGRRRELRDIRESEGLLYVGMHNMLKAPGWLHLTTPDRIRRGKSWDYFRGLVDLCADLGDDGLMILGSARQRNTVEGATRREARGRLSEGLAAVAPAAEARRVRILLEPLAPHLCDVVNNLEEAVSIVEQVGSPGVQSMFDTHNTVAETLPHGEAVRKHYRYIKHVHVNELDGRHPGTGDYDFRPVLQALKNLAYPGWVSLEVFHFDHGPENIARDSATFIRELERSWTRVQHWTWSGAPHNPPAGDGSSPLVPGHMLNRILCGQKLRQSPQSPGTSHLASH